MTRPDRYGRSPEVTSIIQRSQKKLVVCEELLESILEAVQSDSEAERLLSPEDRCAALESLLESVSQEPAFIGTISRALLAFCERGLHCEVEVLLKFKAQLDYPNFTALHVAVERGDAKMVEVLMTQAASASAIATWPYESRCPLVMACLREDLESVRTMLDHGADVNAEICGGGSLLMQSVRERKSLDLLKLLLEKGADPNLPALGMDPQSLVYHLIHSALGKPEEEYAVKVVGLLLRHGFRPKCCRRAVYVDSLLKLCLENFSQLFPLAKLLFGRGEPFDPDHGCWSRLEVLREALERALRRCSEAEARPLVDKANALLDLPIVRPPLLRFTLSALRSHEYAEVKSKEWDVDIAPPSLQSLCRALVCCLLLPFPLEHKIQALPIPGLIKELLMPLNQD